MKLIGYVKPFSPSSFTIPVYKLGKDYFVHKLNRNLIIEDFVNFKFEIDDYFPIKKSLDFKKNDFGPIVYILSNNIPLIEPANLIFQKAYELDEENIQKNPGLVAEFEEINFSTRSESFNIMDSNSIDVIFNNISSNLDLGLEKFIDIFSESVRNIIFLSNTVKQIKIRKLDNISVITLPSSPGANFINKQVMECYVENNLSLPSRFIFANKKAVNKNKERFIEFYNHQVGNQSSIVAARIVSNSAINSITKTTRNIKPLDLSDHHNFINSPVRSVPNSSFLVYSVSVHTIAEGFDQKELKNVWRVLGELGEIDEKFSKAVLNRNISTERSEYTVSYINYEPKDEK